MRNPCGCADGYRFAQHHPTKSHARSCGRSGLCPRFGGFPEKHPRTPKRPFRRPSETGAQEVMRHGCRESPVTYPRNGALHRTQPEEVSGLFPFGPAQALFAMEPRPAFAGMTGWRSERGAKAPHSASQKPSPTPYEKYRSPVKKQHSQPGTYATRPSLPRTPTSATARATTGGTMKHHIPTQT